MVHRDIKASNILIDQQWNAKVSDFGLAKLLCSERSYVTTRVMGTFGCGSDDIPFLPSIHPSILLLDLLVQTKLRSSSIVTELLLLVVLQLRGARVRQHGHAEREERCV